MRIRRLLQRESRISLVSDRHPPCIGLRERAVLPGVHEVNHSGLPLPQSIDFRTAVSHVDSISVVVESLSGAVESLSDVVKSISGVVESGLVAERRGVSLPAPRCLDGTGGGGS